jgi:hypothetical protein
MKYQDLKDQIVHDQHDESLSIRPLTAADLEEIFGEGLSDEVDLTADPLPLNFHTPDEEHL